MSGHSYLAKPFALMLCAIVGGAGCDLIARTGETLVLGNRGTVLGTGGNAQTRPNAAITVQPGATVVVEDSDVFGGGLLIQQADQQRFGRAGSAILSERGGTIRVQQGLVSGGGVILRAAVQVPFDEPAPGIDATDSNIEITGGTLRGGALVSEVGPIPQPPPNTLPPMSAPGIVIANSTLRVTGGSFMPGVVSPAAAFAVPISVVANASQLEILGGTFSGVFSANDGRTRVRGGTFDILVFANFNNPAGCAELRGGQINQLDILGTRAGIALSGGRLIVAGSGLALTPIPDPTGGMSQLTGTLENGQPVNVRVAQNPLSRGVIQLVAPRAGGCP